MATFADINTRARFRTRINAVFRGNAPAVLAAYPVETDAEALPQYEQPLTHLAFRCPARRVARALSEHAEAWLFDFSMVHPSGEASRRGSYHGTDVFYTFGNLEIAGGTAADLDADDQTVTEAMMDYWTSFARTGRPSPGGGPVEWPAHETATDGHVTLDAPITAGTGLLETQCDMFDSFL